MAILDRFNERENKDVSEHVDTGNQCGQDVIDLFEAVKVLTLACKKTRHYNEGLGAKDCAYALEKVWGKDKDK